MEDAFIAGFCLSCKKTASFHVNEVEHRFLCDRFSGFLQIQVIYDHEKKHSQSTVTCTSCCEPFYANHLHACDIIKPCSVELPKLENALLKTLKRPNAQKTDDLYLRQFYDQITSCKVILPRLEKNKKMLNKFSVSLRTIKKAKKPIKKHKKCDEKHSCEVCGYSCFSNLLLQIHSCSSFNRYCKVSLPKLDLDEYQKRNLRSRNMECKKKRTWPATIGSILWKCDICIIVEHSFQSYVEHMLQEHYQPVNMRLTKSVVSSIDPKSLKVTKKRAKHCHLVLMPTFRSEWCEKACCISCGVLYNSNFSYLKHKIRKTCVYLNKDQIKLHNKSAKKKRTYIRKEQRPKKKFTHFISKLKKKLKSYFSVPAPNEANHNSNLPTSNCMLAENALNTNEFINGVVVKTEFEVCSEISEQEEDLLQSQTHYVDSTATRYIPWSQNEIIQSYTLINSNEEVMESVSLDEGRESQQSHPLLNSTLEPIVESSKRRKNKSLNSGSSHLRKKIKLNDVTPKVGNLNEVAFIEENVSTNKKNSDVMHSEDVLYRRCIDKAPLLRKLLGNDSLINNHIDVATYENPREHIKHTKCKQITQSTAISDKERLPNHMALSRNESSQHLDFNYNLTENCVLSKPFNVMKQSKVFPNKLAPIFKVNKVFKRFNYLGSIQHDTIRDKLRVNNDISGFVRKQNQLVQCHTFKRRTETPYKFLINLHRILQGKLFSGPELLQCTNVYSNVATAFRQKDLTLYKNAFKSLDDNYENIATNKKLIISFNEKNNSINVDFSFQNASGHNSDFGKLAINASNNKLGNMQMLTQSTVMPNNSFDSGKRLLGDLLNGIEMQGVVAHNSFNLVKKSTLTLCNNSYVSMPVYFGAKYGSKQVTGRFGNCGLTGISKSVNFSVSNEIIRKICALKNVSDISDGLLFAPAGRLLMQGYRNSSRSFLRRLNFPVNNTSQDDQVSGHIAYPIRKLNVSFNSNRLFCDVMQKEIKNVKSEEYDQQLEDKCNADLSRCVEMSASTLCVKKVIENILMNFED